MSSIAAYPRAQLSIKIGGIHPEGWLRRDLNLDSV